MKSKHPFVQLGLFSSSTTCKFKNTRTTLDVLEIKYYRKKNSTKLERPLINWKRVGEAKLKKQRLLNVIPSSYSLRNILIERT